MKKNVGLNLFILFFLLISFATLQAQSIRYVKPNGAGTKDGSSWENASGDLQLMIINATASEVIWVAGGIYYPSRKANDVNTTTPNDRNNAFVLKEGVKIFGSFSGNEITLNQRDSTMMVKNQSILSGDLGNLHDSTDNAYHVVISVGCTKAAVLDGFSITEGNANGSSFIQIGIYTLFQNEGGGIENYGSSPSLTNLIVVKNAATNLGAGIYNSSSSPVLTNVMITENTVGSSGGGVYNYYSSPVLKNVRIIQNTAVDNGGGIFNYNGSFPVLTNVYINDNSANYGGGICNHYSSSPVLTNVIILGNNALEGGGIFNKYSCYPVLTNVTMIGNNASMGGAVMNGDVNSRPQIRNSIIYGNNSGIAGGNWSITYSLVQGLHSTADGNIDGNTNPLFIDAPLPDLSTGDYRLQPRSPVINKGNNNYYSNTATPNLSAITTDLYGNNRITGTDVDLGAYESYSIVLTPDKNGIIYISSKVSGDFTGSSWSNASNQLQNSINTPGVKQVWVKSGTYKPENRVDNMSDANINDPDNAFVLKEGVKVYGSFAGDETVLIQRTSVIRDANQSILSGDLGNMNDTSDNAYHVVTSFNCSNATVLDGFVIKDGNANGAEPIIINSKYFRRNYGAGVYNESSSPVLTNLIIIGNKANSSGGGIFNDSSSPVLTNVIISDNTANVGSGIYNTLSSPVLINVTILDNNAKYFGGAIYNDLSTPVLTDVTIRGNKASSGGGIYNQSSSPVITNVSISGNTASVGGGIYNIYSSFPVLTNVVISENTASEGGGIYNIFDSSPILTNVTISGNSAGTGGGIYNWKSQSRIRNSIIYGNSSGIYGGESIVSFSLIQGFAEDAINHNLDGNTDPKFIAPVQAGLGSVGDYRLQAQSPVLSKGNNAYFNAGQAPDLSAIQTDLNGKPRIIGLIDLGAYEFDNIALGIGLINYTAEAKNSQAKLSWATASETNNKEFFLSRSLDGKTFTKIGIVAGSLNSIVTREYSFYDDFPQNGINYYRLEQMDMDGKVSDLGIRSVRFAMSNEEIKIYPNPVLNEFNVQFPSGAFEQMDISDNNGKVLERITLNASDYQKKLFLTAQPSGVYYLRLSGKGKVQIRKVVKK